MILSYSFFIDNRVINGGNTCLKQIYISQLLTNIVLIIVNTSFISNFADYYSNCITFKGDELNISNSSFIDNIGNEYGSLLIFSYKGYFSNILIKNCKSLIGAIFMFFLNIKKSNFEFINLIVNSNIASKANLYLFTLFSFEFNFFNCSFQENKVYRQGGVFYIKYISGNYKTHIINIINCIFNMNRANSSGGIGELWQIGGFVRVFNCIFLKNSANEGGVFNINAEMITKVDIDNSIFVENTADSQGGVFNILISDFIINDCVFYFNGSPVAAIFFVCSFSVCKFKNILIDNSINLISSNIVLIASSKTKIQNLTISNSIAIICSGIMVSSFASVEINQIYFYNNSARSFVLFYISNSFNENIFISNINAINNHGSNLLVFHISIANLNEINLFNNTGTIFKIFYSSINLKTIYVNQHKCFINQQGCLINMQIRSRVLTSELYVINLISIESQGIIFIRNSELKLIDGIFKNISCFENADILFSEKSLLTLIKIYIFIFKNNAIFIDSNYEIILNEIFCENNIFQKYSCINITNSESILIENSYFFNLSITPIFISNSQIFTFFTQVINNCTFFNNKFLFSKNNTDFTKGGAIYLKNIKINIDNSVFIYNAAECGGSIFLSSESDLKNKISYGINNNIFINNIATKSGGGGIFWEFVLPTCNNNTFLSNKAVYGNDYASFPVKMIFINEFKQNIFNSVISGDIFNNESLVFSLNDYYGQRVREIRGNFLNAIITFQNIYDFSFNDSYRSINSNFPSILGLNYAYFYNGFFNFSQLRLIALPNNNYTLEINTNLIINNDISLVNNISINDNIINNKYVFLINVTFSDCRLGEIFNKERNICDRCKYGEYSLRKYDLSCHNCPSFCTCLGGNQIHINIGYWRKYINSVNIYKCRNEYSCLGGFESECALGHIGNLCDNCNSELDQRYFKSTNNFCNDCNEMYIGYFIFILFCLFLIIYQSLVINIKMRSKDHQRACIMKILIIYLEMISVIANFEIKISDEILNILKGIGFANNPKQILNSLNCFYGVFNFHNQTNKFFGNSLFLCAFSIIYPILYVLISFFISKFFKKEKNNVIFRLKVSLVIICYSLQNFVLNFLAGAFSCEKIEDQNVLKDYLDFECWVDQHLDILFFIITPFIIIWLILIPLFALFFISKEYSKQENKSFFNKNRFGRKLEISLTVVSKPFSFSFLTDGYKTDKFYWEFIILINRVITITFIKFINDPNSLSVMFICLFFILSMLQILNKPFLYYHLNYLQAIGYMVSMTNIMFCLCIKQTDEIFYHYIFMGSMLVFNLYFLFIWIFFFFKANRSNFLKIKKVLQSMVTSNNILFAKIKKSEFGIRGKKKSVKLEFPTSKINLNKFN